MSGKSEWRQVRGPNRGRAPVRYLIEHLPGGRVRMSVIQGATLHRSALQAKTAAEQLQARYGNTVEFVEHQ